MVVGVVEWAGRNVPELQPDVRPGQSVYAWAPIADVHVLPAKKVCALDDLSPEQALCIDPATFALGGVIDGGIAQAETVLVTGLGAIGLLVVQYCKALGATVLAASSLASRRKLAEAYGAAEVHDPGSHEDLARLIKQRTGGVDVAIECSGSSAGLNRAIRATRQCGRVVCVGFYGSGDNAINLEEFYHNRITLLVSCPRSPGTNPVRGPKRALCQGSAGDGGARLPSEEDHSGWHPQSGHAVRGGRAGRQVDCRRAAARGRSLLARALT